MSIKKNLTAKAIVVPFAVLNHRLEPVEVKAWIGELAQSGIDGVFLHPRIGLLTPYLSESWFQNIKACLEAGRAAGIKVWLYDEFPYPSGVAGGRVLAECPEAIERHLEVFRIPFKGTPQFIGYMDEGPIVEAFLVKRDASGSVRERLRVTDHIGSVNDEWIRTPWDSRHYYNLNDTKLFDCPRSDSLHPLLLLEGDFKEGWEELVVFREKTGSDFLESFGHYIDVSSAVGTRKFLQATHARYEARFGKDFGGLIPGIFTDEPKYRNLLPWSRTIAEAWRDYSVDPDVLFALAESCPRGDQIRRSYRETCGNLFRKNWCEIISSWCAAHRLQLCGHISPEEDWFIESILCGSSLANLRKFQIPGCDLIIPAVGDRKNPQLNLIPALACSASVQSGRDQALCELFGANDYGVTAQDMKRIADWLMIFGINFFTPHGLFYSIDGERKYDAPPTFFKPNSLWDIFPIWVDYVQRTGAELGGPKGVRVDVAIVRPMRRLNEIQTGDAAAARPFQVAIMQTSERLLQKGVMYHFIDDGDLSKVEVDSRRVIFGEGSYSWLVDLTSGQCIETKTELDQLAKLGVQVITPDELNKIPGSLQSESGEARAARTKSGRVLLLNLSDEPQTCRWEGQSYRLTGYESRWTDVPSTPVEKRTRHFPLDGWKVEIKSPNIALLEKWQVDGKPHAPGPLYRIYPELAGETVPSALGRMPAKAQLRASRQIRYETQFYLKDSLTVDLVMEPESAKGDWKATLDGNALENWANRNYYDRFNIAHRLENLAPGWHKLLVVVTVQKSTDGLLDIMRLAGDFIIEEFGAGYPFLAKSRRKIDAADWSSSGYPHYSGAMTYRLDWNNPQDTWKTAVLEVDRPLPAHAFVTVNGIKASYLAWSPWQIDIAPFLKSGKNQIELEVFNSVTHLVYGKGAVSGLGAAKLSIKLAKPSEIAGRRASRPVTKKALAGMPILNASSAV